MNNSSSSAMRSADNSNNDSPPVTQSSAGFFIRRFIAGREIDINLSDIVFNVAATREIEKIYLDADGFALMEQAGAAMARELISLYPPRDTPMAIFAGNGNNGGDGYIVARELLKSGYSRVLVLQAVPQKPGIAAVRARESYLALGGRTEPSKDADMTPDLIPAIMTELFHGTSRSPVIVDALTGIGFLKSRPGDPVFEKIAAAVREINRMGCPVISLDVPSLLNSDTGMPLMPGLAVRASYTLTVFTRKPGLLLGQAGDYAGRVITVLNDLPDFAYHVRMLQAREKLFALNYHDLGRFLPVRARSAHKGDAGRILLVGGSLGMEGALITAGRAALRTGAGLIRAVFSGGDRSALNALNPEIMTGFPENIPKDLAWCDAAVAGPGLGRSARSGGIFREIYGKARKLLVDADGLYWLLRLSENPALMPRSRPETLILTPHVGEAALLTGKTTALVLADPLGTAREISRKYGAITVLKSAATLVSDGEFTVIISTGSRGMASGGMGDLLSGVIGALLAGGMDPFQAAVLGVAVHGEAGCLSEETDGALGMAAGDLLPFIRRLINGRAGVQEKPKEK
ncbi:NAD(P)H-hydrate dehydratase [Succinimonas sp.]|uniref:NAD(P)H-hydrate dehydratase n=1 Tax=Succinimonas sp. TaxID=1936151 RepID=UPI003865BCF2